MIQVHLPSGSAGGLVLDLAFRASRNAYDWGTATNPSCLFSWYIFSLLRRSISRNIRMLSRYGAGFYSPGYMIKRETADLISYSVLLSTHPWMMIELTKSWSASQNSVQSRPKNPILPFLGHLRKAAVWLQLCHHLRELSITGSRRSAPAHESMNEPD